MPDTDLAKTERAKRLRWAREQAGLSQGQVAKILGVHRPTISSIEAGVRHVKADEIQQFAQIYEVEESWIIKGDEVLLGTDDPRIALAARELSKLKQDDLDSILKLIQVLRIPGDSASE